MTCLLWIRSVWGWSPSHSCWLNADLSLLLLRWLSLPGIVAPSGLFSSVSEQWPLLVTITTTTRRWGRVWRRPGRGSRCGGWRPKRTGGRSGSSTDRPPCTCRWSVRGAGTTMRHCTSSPSTTGNYTQVSDYSQWAGLSVTHLSHQY